MEVFKMADNQEDKKSAAAKVGLRGNLLKRILKTKLLQIQN